MQGVIILAIIGIEKHKSILLHIKLTKSLEREIKVNGA